MSGYYKIEIIYEKKEKEFIGDNGLYLGIDPGVNNLATLTSNNKAYMPKIVNGRPVKAINQYYNKKLAKYQSELPKGVYTSKKIKKLTQKRSGKIEHYFHKTSNFIVKECIKNGINTIIIGHNKGWKQEVEMGSKNNQTFVDVPFDMLFRQVAYKAKMNGLTSQLNDESYTSKASFLNLDVIPSYEKDSTAKYEFSGYRKSRGLYKIKGKKKTINADVNGSYNIIRKVAPNAFADGVQGFAVIPVKVTFHERFL